MKNNVLHRTIGNALLGKGAHVESLAVFGGLNWKSAGVRPPGVAHSIFQLLNHMTYWQEWVVRWMDGEDPPIPKHASGSWPGPEAPLTAADWRRAVKRFQRGLRELVRRSSKEDLFTRSGAKTHLEMLHTIGSHTSYHVGQVALLRQMLDSWPPSSGGLTW